MSGSCPCPCRWCPRHFGRCSGRRFGRCPRPVSVVSCRVPVGVPVSHVSNASALTFVCVFTYIQTYVKIFVRSARTYRTVPVWSGSCSVRSPGRSVSACRLVVRAKTLQFTYQLGRCFLFVYYQLSRYIGSHVKISVLLVNPMQDPRFRASCVREQLPGIVGK